MKKKSILYILLDLVFLAVFNTVFFTLGGTSHPASVWISYGFIHLAYIMVIATPVLTRNSSSAAVFGFSLYSVSSVYFLAEFVVGLVFILIAAETVKVTLVVQVILAGFYAVILLANLLANDYTAESVQQHEKEVAYIKDAASRVKLLVGKSSDKKTNKELEKVYDLLHSSPSKSHQSVEILEADIKNVVAALEKAVAADDTNEIMRLAADIMAKTEERNRRLKTL